MKRPILLLLLLSLLLSAACLPASAAGLGGGNNGAVPSAQRFVVDGKTLPLRAFNIDGDNYVLLRDLALALDGTDAQFSVQWDAAAGAVRLTTGEAYVPDGTEDEPPADAGEVRASSAKVLIDGRAVQNLQVYSAGGHNYFRLAQLSPYLHFGLDYDTLNGTVTITGNGTAPDGIPAAAKSYEEIYGHLERSWYGGYFGFRGIDVDFAEEESFAAAESGGRLEVPAPVPAPMPDAPAANGAASAAMDDEAEAYSGTNVQVEGIDEGDIVKTDGKYIYVLDSESKLTIVAAAGGESSVVSRTKLGETANQTGKKNQFIASKNPTEMFISDGRLAILSAYSSYRYYTDSEGSHYENEDYSCVDFFDVSDPAHPKALSSLGQDGNILGSRLQNGRLYLITSYWVWDFEEDDPKSFVPALYENGKGSLMEPGCIWIGGDGTEYVVAALYDMDAGTLTEAQSVLSGSDEIYMTADSLYILGSVWEEEILRSYRESVYTVTEYAETSSTQLLRFDLSDGGLRLAAGGRVPGYIDNQFSADEYNGYFRIVTTRNDSRYKEYEDENYNFSNYQWEESPTTSGLYILDMNLKHVGHVDGLAENEFVYSVRFDGEIAYFCTFRSIDPLFAVDLSAPKAPKVLSALKISGFSEYLHRWDDGLLFGLGREADEKTGRAGGVKLVMFDTSDKTDVKAAHTLELPDVSASAALYDHRAIFIVPEQNYIGFMGEDTYYIYSYDAGEGFKLLWKHDFANWDWNVRGMYIGDYIYLVGQKELAGVRRSDWSGDFTLELVSAGQQKTDEVRAAGA